MKTKTTILLLLLLSLFSQNILAFKPVGGYMNYEKIVNPGYQIKFEAVIFFEGEYFPDSVHYAFGDNKSKFVRLKNTELLCSGLWKCNYEATHTYPGAFNFTVIVSIDSNTVFSGKNVLNPTPFFIETIVSIKEGLITSNKVNHTLNTGLIPFHKDLRFSLPVSSDFVENWHYSIASKHLQIPENSISINAETGDVLIKQLPDTGLYLFSFLVKGAYPFRQAYVVHVTIDNRASANPLSYENALQKDVHGIFYSKTNPGDSLRQTMYLNAPNADSIAVEMMSNIPWGKNPVIETSRLNDSFKIASLFFMDEENYKVLPVTVLYKIKAFKGGVCNEYFSSFYFAPQNYTPTGLERVKQTQLQNILLPNPTTGILQLNAELAINENIEIEILDVTGKKKVFKQTNMQLDISDFTPGVYFVWIKEKGSYIRSEKIIKF